MAELFHKQLRAALLRTSPAFRAEGIHRTIRGFGRQLLVALFRTSPALSDGVPEPPAWTPRVRWLASFQLPVFSGVRATGATRLSSEVIMPAAVAAEVGTARVVTVVLDGNEVEILVRRRAAIEAHTMGRISAGLSGSTGTDVSVELTKRGAWMRGAVTWPHPEPPTSLRLGRHE
ncbi:hypothetical protein [Amycolatopsis sp. cmx-11-51]|uniref:hypothetical protein n=1 Tax=Amycolatopsis sp. cmx-11-51 TaxID=2785797 RepID=UPI0039E45BD5